MPELKLFLINLERSPDRLATMSERLDALGLPWERVVGIEGRALDWQRDARFDYGAYLRRHGKRINPGEIGCYLSHCKALDAFLSRPELESSMILEDDLRFDADFAQVIDALIEQRHAWDMVKLSGFHRGTPVRITALGATRSLVLLLTRMTSAGAYIVNRRAASAYLRGLLPMSLPYDHAFDRGWALDLKVRAAIPLPVQIDWGMDSTIGYKSKEDLKLPLLQRLPCFAFRSANETQRFAHALGEWWRWARSWRAAP